MDNRILITFCLFERCAVSLLMCTNTTQKYEYFLTLEYENNLVKIPSNKFPVRYGKHLLAGFSIYQSQISKLSYNIQPTENLQHSYQNTVGDTDLL